MEVLIVFMATLLARFEKQRIGAVYNTNVTFYLELLWNNMKRSFKLSYRNRRPCPTSCQSLWQNTHLQEAYKSAELSNYLFTWNQYLN